MATHLIIGAGNIGTPLAAKLVARGDSVRVATRRGTQLPGTGAIALDAKDAAAVTEAARGADTIVVCSNPPYPEWAARWPPIFAALEEAATATGARIVLMGNLYGYGAGSGVMGVDTPLATTEKKGMIRVAGWNRLLDAERRGDLRVAEVRASDYFGLGAGANAHIGGNFFGPLLKGRTAWCVGDPTQPHAWAYLPDVVDTLIAAADADQTGRAWMAPHSTSISRREIVAQVNSITGRNGTARSYPGVVFGAMALAMPFIREVKAMSYQFTAPFLVDSAESERALGITATPWAEALSATLDSYGRQV
ncbi:nucleoside-diphosphate-sugar epimerase [Frondihabitans sp. PhB188]|uniref:NAD(P)-binding domain-containing protein n=1 Tax=Frondihabitans sp. PhB188 TaxID=2485200 RepID=UPI000FA61808|nr:NAD(P)-binding domain-containing protein [Frondihabitans sp. PhB188]ROQ41237.1 nucleoside-diphosphate-sugar epimerase [Frondihabitans sp. PhB188]